MISLTHLNGEAFLLNCDQIEYVEILSGTIISFVSGRKMRVLESAEQLMDAIISYKRNINHAKPVWLKEFGREE